jgi:hypothetical protein
LGFSPVSPVVGTVAGKVPGKVVFRVKGAEAFGRGSEFSEFVPEV